MQFLEKISAKEEEIAGYLQYFPMECKAAKLELEATKNNPVDQQDESREDFPTLISSLL